MKLLPQQEFEAIDPALTFVHTLGSSTTCGNDEKIVAR